MKSVLKRSQPTLKVLSHPLTADVFEYIQKNKEVPVNVIYRDLKIEQSVCSMVLARLKKVKLITGVQRGREMHYRTNKENARVLFNSLRAEICGK